MTDYSFMIADCRKKQEKALESIKKAVKCVHELEMERAILKWKFAPIKKLKIFILRHRFIFWAKVLDLVGRLNEKQIEYFELKNAENTSPIIEDI